MPKTLFFLGASTGCGLAALKLAVAAGHTCVALLRVPSKLDAVFPARPGNLVLKAGNAHDVAAVASCLTVPGNPGQLVDAVYFSIGGKLDMSKMGLDDPDVCRKGMATLLEALGQLRAHGAQGRPLIVPTSSTGISDHGRDVPLLFIPMYKLLLAQPHKDKKAMEDLVIKSGERFVVLRPSFFVEGDKPESAIRVGIEDPKNGVEKLAVGYTISREAVGGWVYKHILNGDANHSMFSFKSSFAASMMPHNLAPNPPGWYDEPEGEPQLYMDPRVFLLAQALPLLDAPPQPIANPLPPSPPLSPHESSDWWKDASSTPQKGPSLIALHHAMDKAEAQRLCRGVDFSRDDDSRYKCPVAGCGSTFKFKHLAVRHLWEKQTLCGLCGGSFARGDNGARRRHEATPACKTGRKPRAAQ
ncbi:hypothetical protein AURDEDRAFT_166359 [Auricularia subglabra TFB-10046 SS5]|uniref:NAD(P)-binding domain-containing protein n=1 Tax=Auricularia subglabra (strain TFB-10046 / SS5) TaxID=717982 RepID=J0DDP0_AURST|nr:hypothetical protein AURDEDRAFT_166359 [Auricularia subglabra TFB-10046 SS5]